MSLIDRIRGNRNNDSLILNEREAFVAIVLSVAMADGVIQQEETATIAINLSRMKMFRRYNPDINAVRNLINRHSVEAVLSVAKQTLSLDVREAAFAVATDVAIADGSVSQTEEERLLFLCKTLDIPMKTAEKIVEVMLIKNRA